MSPSSAERPTTIKKLLLGLVSPCFLFPAPEKFERKEKVDTRRHCVSENGFLYNFVDGRAEGTTAFEVSWR